MTNSQKKIISICFILLFILITAASIVIYVIGHVNKDKILQMVGFISTMISPTTLVGVIIKYFMNKSHSRAIDNKLNEAGLNLTPIEQAEIEKTYKNTNSNFFRFKSFVFIEKEDKIIIKYTPNENKENGAKELREAFLEFLEYKRKKEQ